MKKWHMENIINLTNNTQRKLVVQSGGQMYLQLESYGFQTKRRTQRSKLLKSVNKLFSRKGFAF